MSKVFLIAASLSLILPFLYLSPKFALAADSGIDLCNTIAKVSTSPNPIPQYTSSATFWLEKDEASGKVGVTEGAYRIEWEAGGGRGGDKHYSSTNTRVSNVGVNVTNQDGLLALETGREHTIVLQKTTFGQTTGFRDYCLIRFTLAPELRCIIETNPNPPIESEPTEVIIRNFPRQIVVPPRGIFRLLFNDQRLTTVTGTAGDTSIVTIPPFNRLVSGTLKLREQHPGEAATYRDRCTQAITVVAVNVTVTPTPPTPTPGTGGTPGPGISGGAGSWLKLGDLIKNPKLQPPNFFNASFGTIVSGFLRVAFFTAGFLMLFWLSWAVFQYIFASGDKEKLAKARGRITWAIVGFLITVVAFALSEYAQQIFPLQNIPLTEVTIP